jgi:hypothetical protein
MGIIVLVAIGLIVGKIVLAFLTEVLGVYLESKKN